MPLNPEALHTLWIDFPDDPLRVMEKHVRACPEDAGTIGAMAQQMLEAHLKGQGFFTVQVASVRGKEGALHIVECKDLDYGQLRYLAMQHGADYHEPN